MRSTVFNGHVGLDRFCNCFIFDYGCCAVGLVNTSVVVDGCCVVGLVNTIVVVYHC